MLSALFNQNVFRYVYKIIMSRSVATITGSDFRREFGFTLSLSESGDVYAFGKHPCGAHGFKENEVFPPKPIPSIKNIKAISCGKDHSLCLDKDGIVYSFGKNNMGQLGVGKSGDELEFTHEPQKLDLPPIKQVCCGMNFSICISEEGHAFSFGKNSHGQLGIGNKLYQNKPMEIESFGNIDFVACGSTHSVFKLLNNEIYVCGYNGNDELGIGFDGFQVDDDGEDTPLKCDTCWPDNVVDVKCGSKCNLVLTSNKEVFFSGMETCVEGADDGEISGLRKIDYLKNIVRVECGFCHFICIDENGDLFIFGDNFYGELGLENTKSVPVPIKHPSLSNIIDISKGGDHTFVKTSNNEIYAFGYNRYSQLGIKTEDSNQHTPIRVFEDNEDIWFSNINKSKAKSARF